MSTFSNVFMSKRKPYRPQIEREPLPRSFKDLTPAKHFNPRTFFREMVWKTLLTRRTGQHRVPVFPKLIHGQVALTWIGHASFLAQFNDLNVLIDPNFANWIFLLKRINRAGLKIHHLPPIDLVLLTHAHFDHFHKPTLRRLPSPKIGVMPWGMGDLARNLGFDRIIELQWWESFTHENWKVTLTPTKHWGARMIHDEHRGYGYEFPPVGERLSRLEEALQICRAMFREEAPTFEGRYYRIDGALNFPRPIQPNGPPIMIGGGGEQRTLKLVAQYANMCNIFGDVAIVRHKMDVLERHCQAVGRDPKTIVKTRLGSLIIRESDADARRRATAIALPSADRRRR